MSIVLAPATPRATSRVAASSPSPKSPAEHAKGPKAGHDGQIGCLGGKGPFDAVRMITRTLAIAAVAVIGAAAISPASADIMFSTGNQQYTNVNIVSNTNATSVVGDIGNTGYSITFENMISPYAPSGDGSSQIEMHCSNGVAFCESYADSLPSTQNPTGFSSLTLMAQPGTAWNAGDLALDLLGSTDTNVVFQAYNGNTPLNVQASSTCNFNTCPIDASGQNHYNYLTFSGELVTKLVMTSTSPYNLADIKQVSLQVVATPEPASIMLLGAGLAALGVIRRRKRA